MNIKPLLTTSDVAKILGLSEKTVRKLKDRGLTPINFGGRFRYRSEDVEAFIQNQSKRYTKPFIPPIENQKELVIFPGLDEFAIHEIKKRMR